MERVQFLVCLGGKGPFFLMYALMAYKSWGCGLMNIHIASDVATKGVR